MASEEFDAIVVGAGPAGAAAALTMARGGLNVVLFERGERPGVKNVMGGVMYGRMLADVVPEFWKTAPMERVVTDERLWLTTADSVVTAGHKHLPHSIEPPNAFTVLRVPFDGWFAAQAEAAGALLIPGTTVDDVIREHGRVVGVRTGREEGELRAHLVVIADGANSFLVQKAGLGRPLEPNEMALVVKEIIALPGAAIEERFTLDPGMGATIEVYGAVTRGMAGYGFIYTNRESLSVGIGALISQFMETRITPWDLLEGFKAHPMVAPLLRGGVVREYLAHAIPEGGLRAMPRLFDDGVLVAGDAAMMVNNLHREGSNMAMAAGRMAGETAIQAKRAGDWSARSLAQYRELLEASFVLQDLRKYRRLPDLVERRPDLLRLYPELVSEAVHEMLTVDGAGKREKQRRILRRLLARRPWWRLIRDAYEGWRAMR
ncbi:MAG: FAD-dependent oxidoreductase [Bacillati bacterium ANGP1]|uniref:FAD-dependent oxidoreductase n=1 Tax=Candidatus Segetimicrobium genomatis TaxID=2569760 RepID=A0A537K5C6_9BACT|nr:MAG: FAD-dependent oxidoreductase [Terrabacteria group bacterium ANGP1]